MNAPARLWSLWDMLRNYLPIYNIALSLQSLRTTALFFKDSVHKAPPQDEVERFYALLNAVHQSCPEYGLNYTSDMAKRILDKPALKNYADIFPELDHLNESLRYELEKEAVFSIPPARKDYFERDDLFGSKVATAFPSCARDIQRAGSCYALEQEDACVHHLMLVLERGLNALAGKVGVPFQHTNWQTIINEIAAKLNSLKKGAERDFYLEVTAQFGFLKNAYRNHSEHAHDDFYDMPKALHILNHVRDFMQALDKGGLSE